ncbi:MAG TPA: BadF/BadG/BcrA/BcrD ATPase family protein [Rubrivivax sp.]|nr:BadF/BadG/BcrA/BcrD ATPase family protein [Rubrivivax sp.]
MPPTSQAPRCALGIDAGGTATRWALAGPDGAIVAEGRAAPASGLQMYGADGRAALAGVLGALAAALPQPPAAAAAGVSGLDASQAAGFAALLAGALGIDAQAAQATSDIEMLCLAAFVDAPPGTGIVLYAGTGSIAALRDARGVLQRAGGRGHLIDDAGGGHWIAREALARVWRAEDESPGAWHASPLAQRLFAHIGGSDWAATRQHVYGPGAGERGRLGRLALAVAEAADTDAAARSVLEDAGRELARLVRALLRRHGAQPVVRAGRVFDLHPAVADALHAALPAGTPLRALGMPAQHAAARLALHMATRRTSSA